MATWNNINKSASIDFILLEDSSFLLLEDGGRIQLEKTGTVHFAFKTQRNEVTPTNISRNTAVFNNISRN